MQRVCTAAKKSEITLEFREFNFIALLGRVDAVHVKRHASKDRLHTDLNLRFLGRGFVVATGGKEQD